MTINTQQQDAIIIGAGVIGCAIALELTRRGLKTVNVDTLPAAGYGSTSHSSAIIRPYYSHVTAAALAHESRYRWLDWASYLDHADPRGLAQYTESGGLVLLREGAEAEHANNLAVLDAVGIDYELLDAAGVRALYPGICLDAFGPPKPRDHPQFGEPVDGRISGGIYLPAAGYVSDPQLAAHNLMAAAAAVGASFQFNARVTAVRVQGSKATGVRLADGSTLAAPVIINVAGPHSHQINALAGITDQLRIQTHAHRHEIVYLQAPPSWPAGGGGFVADLDAGVYHRPDGADLLIGTTDPACDVPERVHPDDYHSGFTEQWTTQAYRAAQRFPALAIESRARGTVGLYDVSDDWIPLYDKTDLPGFYIAIGTSGNQFKNAPLVGELMANIVLAAGDHDLQPATLALPHVGRAVDLSFYSRNRQVQHTQSVLA